LTPAKKPEATHAYTLEQAENIVTALVEQPVAQLVFALACFLGLRPGEIAGLQWSDITTDESGTWLHVRRAAWRSIVGTTKTEESVASVPVIEPIRSMLASLKVQSGGREWVFPSSRGDRPHSDINQLVRLALKSKGIEYRGLYAGRRGAATLLVQLTGNAVAAQYVLRHKNLGTTTAFYVKPVQTAAMEGLKLLESKLAERKTAFAEQANAGGGQ
jgi:integrase